jgi:enoyl-CoA hydratase
MDYVRTDIDGGIAVVTLDRPPVNALDSQAFRELTETFDQLSATRDAQVAIFTAAGDRAFCGGVDLQDSARRRGQVDAGAPVADLLDPGAVARECFWALHDCRIPVIGAINAAAVGAGLALAASCDILIASERARFALTEINAGVLGGGRFLQRLVGPYKTRMLFFTGEFASADELYRLGAVEAVVPHADLMTEARALAERIARKSPIGLRLAKESLNRVEQLPLKEGYHLEQEYTGRITRYDDSGEARRAYLEKRDPDWTWR